VRAAQIAADATHLANGLVEQAARPGGGCRVEGLVEFEA
jgi:hypothetical protein